MAFEYSNKAVETAKFWGSSRMVEAVIRHTWVMVANNIKGTTEILRRLVMIELDAKTANPENRSGWHHTDLKDWVRKNRGQLVWACLTLIQNFVAKEMKPWGGELKGSFEEWSRIMGGILHDAGIRGFLGNESHLRTYAAIGGDSGVQQFIHHLAGEYDSGVAFRPGGTSKIRGHSGAVVSLQDELNLADDGNAKRRTQASKRLSGSSMRSKLAQQIYFCLGRTSNSRLWASRSDRTVSSRMP